MGEENVLITDELYNDCTKEEGEKLVNELSSVGRCMKININGHNDYLVLSNSGNHNILRITENAGAGWLFKNDVSFPKLIDIVETFLY